MEKLPVSNVTGFLLIDTCFAEKLQLLYAYSLLVTSGTLFHLPDLWTQSIYFNTAQVAGV